MAPSTTTTDAWTGRLVGGRWRIVSLLDDSGGMASVYLARDERLERQAVVKMPKASHLNEEFAERFAREAKWHAKVENLHVVHILDRGEEEGTPYLVLQYLPGGNLKAWCGKNPSILDDPRLHYEAWLLPIAQALDAVAEQGIVHRDVKPSNILFDAAGQAYLSDFGIVKAGDATMTGTGMFIGTLQFMSPEQCQNERLALDGRSDQYGLAVTAYQVLTGWKYPTPDDTGVVYAAKFGHTRMTEPREHEPRVPPAVNAAVMRALSVDRDKRFSSSVEFAEAVLLGFGSLGERRATGRGAVAAVPESRDFQDRPTERPSPSAADTATQWARDGGNAVASGLPGTPHRPPASGASGTRASVTAMVFGAGAIAAALLAGGFLLGRSGGQREDAGSSATASASVAEPRPNMAASTQPAPRAAASIVESVPSPVPATRDFDVVENSLGMKLVRIPAGQFEMGSNDGEAREKPPHTVRITKPFLLGQTEVTQGQWQRVMNTTPWRGQTFAKDGPTVAASYVSWDDAVEFCRKLTEIERRAGRLRGAGGYRLPTEAEWEYACRAGTKTRFSFGDDESGLSDYGWFDGNAWAKDEKYAHEVGQKNPNPWNLLDIHGNVWEWCSDWYDEGYYLDEGYYKTSPAADPKGPDAGSFRVIRGGSWFLGPVRCRSASRSHDPPAHRLGDVGFRVVCELE